MILDTSTPVVVLACPHHGGLGVTRSLGRLGIPIFNVDATRWAPASFSRYCRDRFIWDIDNSPGEQSVAKLVEVARKAGRRCLLIPGSDRSAVFAADHSAALEPWYMIPVPERALVHSFCSKKRMLDLAVRHNVATPATIGIETRAERLESLKKMDLPMIIKGIDGHARKRCGKTKLIVRTKQQLLALYEWIGESDAPGLIAQEYIPGSESTVWMFNGYFNQRSECVAGFTGRKLRQCPAYTGVTSLGICQQNDAVKHAAIRLLSGAGYRGLVDMDFRYDARDGQYKLLDVNPRLGSTFRLFVSTDGLDVARACYLDLTGQPVSSAGVSEGRKWLVEDFDLVSSLRYMLDGNLHVREWVKSLRGIHESAFFAKDDPLSMLLMLRADAAQLLRHMRGEQGFHCVASSRPQALGSDGPPQSLLGAKGQGYSHATGCAESIHMSGPSGMGPIPGGGNHGNISAGTQCL
jgi:D-aspartate ligase